MVAQHLADVYKEKKTHPTEEAWQGGGTQAKALWVFWVGRRARELFGWTDCLTDRISLPSSLPLSLSVSPGLSPSLPPFPLAHSLIPLLPFSVFPLSRLSLL